MPRMSRRLRQLIWLLSLPAVGMAQLPTSPQSTGAAQPFSQVSPQDQLRPSYVLGPDDQIIIRAFEVEEISEKPFRVDGDGFVNLPLLGRVHAGGLTVQEFEAELTTRLKTYVKSPQVFVTVVQFRSDPIFFVGAFKAPGIYPLLGRRTLVEMLSGIGGLQPNASRRIRVTRRLESGPIPLPNAVVESDRKVSYVDISLGSLRENVNPAEDILLKPFDVITVERAEMVYVSGEVGKVGGFELGERESISVSKLLTLAGGLGRDARADKARVLRPVLNTSRRAEIRLNLRKILAGKTNDFPLLPNDLLYVPRTSRNAALKTVGLLSLGLLPSLIYLAVR